MVVMMSSTDCVVQIEQLRKVFRVGFWGRRVTAVDGLSLEVQRGEVFGFLGPNGAGKTTTIKMLMALIYPTGGTATLFGRPVGDPIAKAKVCRSRHTFMTILPVENSCVSMAISLGSWEVRSTNASMNCWNWSV